MSIVSKVHFFLPAMQNPHPADTAYSTLKYVQMLDIWQPYACHVNGKTFMEVHGTRTVIIYSLT